MEEKEEIKLTFEEGLKKLEEIVSMLESGTVPMEDAVKMFEEGQRIAKLCYGELEVAKGKLTTIKEELGKLVEE